VEDEESIERYTKDLKQLNDWAASRKTIGSMAVLETLQEEVLRINSIMHSVYTVMDGLDGWLSHFAYNLRRMPPENRWPRPDTIKDSAIVIGAGPSLTDDQISSLIPYKGTIICTNKSLERCYRLGVYPQFVVTAHPTDEILPHFQSDIVHEHLYMTGVVLSTITDPKVTDEILKYTDNVYWYNPSIPSAFIDNVDTTLNIISNRMTIDTGGNVGIFGCICGLMFGARTIGILGMEHCHSKEASKEWTNEKSAEFDWEYAPEDDMLCCVTPLFRSYLYGLITWYKNVRENDPGFDVINLTKFGPLYTQRRPERTDWGMRYMEVGEFVKGNG